MKPTKHLTLLFAALAATVALPFLVSSCISPESASAPRETERFGEPCPDIPSHPHYLGLAFHGSLYIGETKEDAVFNAAERERDHETPLYRNSLFLRQTSQGGVEEWRVLLTTGSEWRLGDGSGDWKKVLKLLEKAAARGHEGSKKVLRMLHEPEQDEAQSSGPVSYPAGSATKNVGEFVIPKSLVTRMYEAHDRARDKAISKNVDASYASDTLELWALATIFQMENAGEISKRPRREMSLVDDLNSDAERKELWPFDIEAFETQLEAQMVRGDDGCFCRRSPRPRETWPFSRSTCQRCFKRNNVVPEEWTLPS